MPVDLLVSWNDGVAKRVIADTNCPEVAGSGLNVQFHYRDEECDGCPMC
jgi:hypothetical protein